MLAIWGRVFDDFDNDKEEKLAGIFVTYLILQLVCTILTKDVDIHVIAFHKRRPFISLRRQYIWLLWIADSAMLAQSAIKYLTYAIDKIYHNVNFISTLRLDNQ